MYYKGYEYSKGSNGEWFARKKGNKNWCYRAWNKTALFVIIDAQAMFTSLFGF